MFRYQCRLCTRSYPKAEMPVGICPYCLEERARKLMEEFNAHDYSNGIEQHKCFRCKGVILTSAYIHFDVGARAHQLLCVPCFDNVASRDTQFRNTPFSYQKKFQ